MVVDVGSGCCVCDVCGCVFGGVVYFLFDLGYEVGLKEICMIEVVIVLIVCMLLVKFWCGVFNMMYGVMFGGYVVVVVFECVKFDFVCVEDVIMGCVNFEGVMGVNIVW